jgi:phosphatidylglycerophosphate synthase
VWTVSAGAQGVALALLALAVLSDVLDGPLARRLEAVRPVACASGAVASGATASGAVASGAPASRAAASGAAPAGPVDAGRRLGGYLDVGADAIFLVSGLTALWVVGAAPGWLPLVAVGMLARFLATPTSAGPLYDPVGRHYGSLLYAVLAVRLAGVPAPVWTATLSAVVLATVASLFGRTWFLRRLAGARSPA